MLPFPWSLTAGPLRIAEQSGSRSTAVFIAHLGTIPRVKREML